MRRGTHHNVKLKRPQLPAGPLPRLASSILQRQTISSPSRSRFGTASTDSNSANSQLAMPDLHLTLVRPFYRKTESETRGNPITTLHPPQPSQLKRGPPASVVAGLFPFPSLGTDGRRWSPRSKKDHHTQAPTSQIIECNCLVHGRRPHPLHVDIHPQPRGMQLLCRCHRNAGMREMGWLDVRVLAHAGHGMSSCRLSNL